MNLSIHHVAIICSDLNVAKRFYVEALGFKIIRETFRAERQSWKVDLDIEGHSQIELFTFPGAPARISNPEALGLRHVAFRVDNLDESLKQLATFKIEPEPIRTDELTDKRFTFLRDPDGLPIELYEMT